MIKKFKKVVLILPIMILFSITYNYIQKAMVDNGHTHYEHDSLIHIHKHSHLDDNEHSHYHASKSITFLDHFCTVNHNIDFDFNENSKTFDLISINLDNLKNTLFKPPRFI